MLVNCNINYLIVGSYSRSFSWAAMLNCAVCCWRLLTVCDPIIIIIIIIIIMLHFDANKDY